MISKVETFVNKFEKNKRFIVGFDIVAVFIIAFMSFCKVGKGLDITDSTYSLTNFMFLDRLDGMWLYSTFYANLLGRLFILLPGGATLIGIRCYTSFIKFILALLAYFFFAGKVNFNRFACLFGVVTSLGLCWCPETILYNYLSYLLFFAGAAFLYLGLAKEKTVYLVVAGLCLGSNVFVRLPNVVEAGLIVVLWIDSAVKKEKFSKAFSKTMWCILGYVVSFIPAAVLVMINGGIGAYISGITEMLGMSSEAQGYGPLETVLLIIRSFLAVKSGVAITLLVIFVTTIWVYTVRKVKNTFEPAAVILVITAAVLLVVKLYRNGFFTTAYNTYGSFFGLGRIIVFMIYLYMVFCFFRGETTPDEKRLAVMVVVIGLITPLGTNNELYSVLNNMFFALPVAWHFATKDIAKKKLFECTGIVLSVLLIALMFQSTMFCVTYTFRDGIEAPLEVKAYGNENVNGTLTTAENAVSIAGISEFWQANRLREGEVLLYGDVSGMSYILNTPFAISTAWPSLYSFSESKFEGDMNKLKSSGSTPAVLMTNREFNELFEESLNHKQEILKEFLENRNYTIAYQNDKFTVLLANRQ